MLWRNTICSFAVSRAYSRRPIRLIMCARLQYSCCVPLIVKLFIKNSYFIAISFLSHHFELTGPFLYHYCLGFSLFSLFPLEMLKFQIISKKIEVEIINNNSQNKVCFKIQAWLLHVWRVQEKKFWKENDLLGLVLARCSFRYMTKSRTWSACVCVWFKRFRRTCSPSFFWLLTYCNS